MSALSEGRGRRRLFCGAISHGPVRRCGRRPARRKAPRPRRRCPPDRRWARHRPCPQGTARAEVEAMINRMPRKRAGRRAGLPARKRAGLPARIQRRPRPFDDATPLRHMIVCADGDSCHQAVNGIHAVPVCLAARGAETAIGIIMNRLLNFPPCPALCRNNARRAGRRLCASPPPPLARRSCPRHATPPPLRPRPCALRLPQPLPAKLPGRAPRLSVAHYITPTPYFPVMARNRRRRNRRLPSSPECPFCGGLPVKKRPWLAGAKFSAGAAVISASASLRPPGPGEAYLKCHGCMIDYIDTGRDARTLLPGLRVEPDVYFQMRRYYGRSMTARRLLARHSTAVVRRARGRRSVLSASADASELIVCFLRGGTRTFGTFAREDGGPGGASHYTFTGLGLP